MKIGFGITGSHCTYDAIIPALQQLVASGHEVTPIVSHTVQTTSTRFKEAAGWLDEIERLTGKVPIKTIVDAEPLGPTKAFDVMVIAPLTGTSMSKLANAQNDTPVLMAAKATMRNGRPLVLALSTNDGLGLNGGNLMKLMATKHVFFVPFGQDDYVRKPNSLVSHLDLLAPTIDAALSFTQLQPVLLQWT